MLKAASLVISDFWSLLQLLRNLSAIKNNLVTIHSWDLTLLFIFRCLLSFYIDLKNIPAYSLKVCILFRRLQFKLLKTRRMKKSQDLFYCFYCYWWKFILFHPSALLLQIVIPFAIYICIILISCIANIFSVVDSHKLKNITFSGNVVYVCVCVHVCITAFL